MSGAAARTLAVATVLLAAATADAHDVRGTALFVDVGERAVAAELRLPAAQLAMATAQRSIPTRDALDGYIRAHLQARTREGALFSVALEATAVEPTPDGPLVVARLALRPPAGAPARFIALTYDGIVHRVVTHNVYVFVRRDLRTGLLGDKPELAGMLHYQQRTLTIDRTEGSSWHALAAMFRLGLQHIAEGTDHLLFLLMLLLPAPLVARDRRWREPRPRRDGLRAIAAIVTAFSIGHSSTLVLGAFGVVRLPAAPVETLIAVSIFVAALHAVRPLFPRREALVAGGFGLVHGLGFASVLTGFGFDRLTLAQALLGFNLGVEAMQLVIVGVTLPWLMLMSGSVGYRYLRVGGAAFGALAALGWIGDRAFGWQTPIPSWVEAVAARAPALAGALAVAAVVVVGRARAVGRAATAARRQSRSRGVAVATVATSERAGRQAASRAARSGSGARA